MLTRIRKHFSFANVIASLALFIALGGVSYAATIAAKNSVRSSSIKNGQVKTADLATNAVTSTKIKNGQVAGADLAAGAVNSAKIADGSVARGDLAAGARFRAWGAISSSGALTHANGIASVNHPATGVYCVAFTAGLGVNSNSLVVPLLQTIGSTQSHIEVRWETEPVRRSGAAGNLTTVINFRDSGDVSSRRTPALFVARPVTVDALARPLRPGGAPVTRRAPRSTRRQDQRAAHQVPGVRAGRRARSRRRSRRRPAAGTSRPRSGSPAPSRARSTSASSRAPSRRR